MTALDKELLALVRSVSDRIILPRYQRLSADQIEEKATDDFVTIADRESELALTEGLARIDLSLPIVGEEAVHADPAGQAALSGACWIVDPLDGTHNFAAGRPPFGILIARSDGGICRSGWIYDCLSGRFCSAHEGTGAFINGTRITAHSTDEHPPVAALSMLFLDPAKRARMKQAITPHYRVVDIPRCAAEQYPRLALGANDVSYFERTLAWDHAAGVLFLNEAGGRAARPDGRSYRVDEHDQPGLIGAASPALWDALAERLQDVI